MANKNSPKENHEIKSERRIDIMNPVQSAIALAAMLGSKISSLAKLPERKDPANRERIASVMNSMKKREQLAREIVGIQFA